MDKRRLHHIWTRVRAIKPWYFMAAALVSGIVCVFALRANNLHMVQLREAVYAADKDNGDTEGALRNLRSYVYGHMNTNLASGPNAVHPPIQLKYTYDRLSKAQPSGADSNSEIYNQAQKYCEQAIPNGVSGSYRLSCIQAYVKQHGITTVQTVPKELYQFDFVSPAWSPDLAGWSLVVTVLLALCAIGSWLFRNVFRHLLHT
jgi:hypothetical protein